MKVWLHETQEGQEISRKCSGRVGIMRGGVITVVENVEHGVGAARHFFFIGVSRTTTAIRALLLANRGHTSGAAQNSLPLSLHHLLMSLQATLDESNGANRWSSTVCQDQNQEKENPEISSRKKRKA
jgi:hypothetical protein